MDTEDLEGDASAIYALAGCDDDDPPAIAALCRVLLGSPPVRASIRHEAQLAHVDGAWRVLVRRDVSAERARWLVGHELAEWWHLRHDARPADIEARCDTLGAMLVAPRRAYRRALRALGHRVHALASAFGVEQELALLRIGEVTGRPVALLRAPGVVLARGEPYVWDRRAVEHRAAHPVRVGQRWGLMASDATSAAAR